ncbi:alpha/beta hydrolase family protein [Corynebacterium auriscanis]|uniref:alpha/beta hydrolase family protein n=1 Tax=Corynebacterium auriscanis TaxID=99807 RepID=UPI003CF2B5C0
MSPATISTHVSIPAGEAHGPNGTYNLGATVDAPAGMTAETLQEGRVPTAIVVACFTCARTAVGVTRISKTLAKHGMASLRIDLAGLGTSGGAFEKTTLSSNVADVLAAAAWLETHAQGPSLLVGHSLGGCAVIRAAAQVDSVRAVATIGTPFDPRHVWDSIPQVAAELGAAVEDNRDDCTVPISDRGVSVGTEFFRDLRSVDPEADMQALKQRGIQHLGIHAPDDDVVDYAEALSFVSSPARISSLLTMPDIDHLLQRRGSGQRVGELIATWFDHRRTLFL